MNIKAVNLLREFITSERAGGFLLISCTLFSLWITNSSLGSSYLQLWNYKAAGESLTHWINDGLMTVFFLLLGLELKREFLEGQFSSLKNALLPVFAAVGGMLLPAGFHLLFNYGTATEAGAGIPMATDAAFALAILSVVGRRAPFSLKMLLVAIAVIDDLCAIIVIAVFYTGGLHWGSAALALAVFSFLLVLNRLRVENMMIYLLGGVVLWYCMLHSGVHATISGVLLALAIPYNKGKGRESTPSSALQHRLHVPVAFLILPLFALANTCILVEGNLAESLSTRNSRGILTGLLLGKPLGIFFFSFLAVKLGVGSLPSELKWRHVLGIGILAGIGFTIAIFISLLAFDQPELTNQSKIAVLTASASSALIAFLYLTAITKSAAGIS